MRCLQLGRADLESPELIQVQRLERVKVLGQQEGVALEHALLHIGKDLPVLPRQPDSPVFAVIVLEHGPAKNTDLQVLHVDVGEDRFLELPPDPVLAALVEVVHVRGDVGEEKRVVVGALRLGQVAPDKVRAPGEVSTVQAVAAVELVAVLEAVQGSGDP